MKVCMGNTENNFSAKREALLAAIFRKDFSEFEALYKEISICMATVSVLSEADQKALNHG